MNRKWFFLGSFLLSLSILLTAIYQVQTQAQMQLATDCTLYASPTGLDSNNGTSSSTPKTLSGATTAATSGAVLCVMGGTYNIAATIFIPNSGTAWTAGNFITMKAYGDNTPILNWTGGSSSGGILQFFGNGSPPFNGKSYYEINGLTLQGNGAAGTGISAPLRCQNSHHIRYINNTILNAGAGGITTSGCDYVHVEGNIIYKAGYNQGFSSGISFNSPGFFNATAGFHSYVLRNTISGSFDASTNHSDGNGIIMDLSDGVNNIANANTPAVLIANNVVFQTGGRCIQTLAVSDIWVVNNSCFGNVEDSTLSSYSGTGELVTNNSVNGYWVNNVCHAFASHDCYQKLSSNTNITYRNNLRWLGAVNFSPGGSDNFLNANPLYKDPPTAVVDGQSSAVHPLAASNRQRFIVNAGSPAIDAGINPASLSGLPAEIVTGLNQYATVDVRGLTRPQNTLWDLGAYEIACP